MENNYHKEKNIENVKILNEIKYKLPFFCNEYFMGIESRTSILTRINYARDLLTFFEFLTQETEEFFNNKIQRIEVEDLDKISVYHIELYQSYLTMYKKNDNVLTNQEITKSRKISAIRSLLRYFYRKGKIKENIGDKLEMPKIREKEIVRLDSKEISSLLSEVENGNQLTDKQRDFHKKTLKRDVAMITLMLGTGIRVSECVGIDITDINFNQNAFTVTRKGGKRSILYFSDEVKDALLDYMYERMEMKVDTNALFLSIQNKRMCVRSVENMVKKYAQIITPLKNITPHKLRSTYGTNLYRATKDIYMVAQVLGHSDVNTTRKHYAAIDEDIKKAASDKVILKNNDNKNSEN
ncbi:MAG: tyrosine-type recombinase/integrase [Clostridia bacterium]|nr:tyrosine-type recombinase/integrase [Clostridia bacterium]